MNQHTRRGRPPWARGVALAVSLIAAAGASWGQQEEVSLPNPGFEQVGGTVAPQALADAVVANRVPAGWVGMQWAPVRSKFQIAVEPDAGLRGTAALAARNLDATARPGVATRVGLPSGRYLLTFLVRCQEGKRGLVRAYLGDAYCPLERVGPGWRRVTRERSIRTALDDAEIRLQNCSRTVTTVWFEDVSLRRIAPRSPTLVPDKRRRPPKTLLLSPLPISALGDDAATWAERGFGGFLLQGIMNDCRDDVWSVDGDPTTMGEDDGTLQELQVCNAACRAYDIDTFLYIPCASPLPVLLDDRNWSNVLEGLQQAAVFAARAECKGVAIDVEAVADQFWPQWAGYDYAGYAKATLRQAARARGEQIARVVFGAEPTLELLLMPEGLLEYGPLFGDMFRGIMEHAGEA
ncbi:MAG: hypothetical protein ACE5JM_05630, partial [Armatimonadota bacterium]